MERGVCKYNKQINCGTWNGCEKCSWNPKYYEVLKQKRREERAKK